MRLEANNPMMKLGEDLKIRLLEITPTIADEWLRKNCENNRPVGRARVRQYAADMRRQRWQLSDQCITFDLEGRLVNGQHRLHACVLAGQPFLSLVLHGLPDAAMLTLDGGKKRTTDDNATITGQGWPRGCGATVRRILMGTKSYAGRSYTDQEVAEFMDAYAPSVAFAHQALPKGKTATAVTRAVLSRAHIAKSDSRRLGEFARVLTTGMMVPGDEAAVLLRNHMLETDSGGGSQRQKLYALTESALKAFLAGTAIKKLTAATVETFPIPGEGEWDAE